nr:MAG TPA: hypothetical protein [Caudoviricetes sp.]
MWSFFYYWSSSVNSFSNLRTTPKRFSATMIINATVATSSAGGL